MKQIFWHDLHRVRKAYWEFHSYLVKNGIFVQAELKTRLRTLGGMIDDAVVEKKFEEENPVPRAGRFEKGQRLRAEGPVLFKNIESEISQRLWSVEIKG